MTLAQQLFSFQGRLTRQPWWIVGILTGVVFVIIEVVVALALGVHPTQAGAEHAAASGGMFGLVVLILGLISFWIGLALNIKRFHDRDKSGWWVLIFLIPVIGFFWLLIECGFLRGTQGDNRFGGDPLAAT